MPRRPIGSEKQMFPGNKWLPEQQGDYPKMENQKTKWPKEDHSHSKVIEVKRLVSGSKCTKCPINQFNKHRHKRECKNDHRVTKLRQAELNFCRYKARIGAS